MFPGAVVWLSQPMNPNLQKLGHYTNIMGGKNGGEACSLDGGPKAGRMEEVETNYPF